MARTKANFFDKVLDRLKLLDRDEVQSVMRRLAQERRLLEMVFNIVEDGILVVDQHGRVQYLNQGAARILGLQNAADAEGDLIQQHLPALDWEKLRRLDAQGGPGVARQEFEVNWPRPRFLRLFAAPLDGDTAGRAGLALIVNDATEARQKTFEAIESERLQALTLLAASVAHEIGNPLNALNIHLQLLERELRRLRTTLLNLHEAPSPPRTRKAARPEPLGDALSSLDKLQHFAEVARGEIGRLDYIVHQFLQATRPSPPKRKPSNLNTAVGETLELLQPELDNRGILVTRRLSDTLPITPFDPDQVKQALMNLIRNAMQAMPRGGTLTLETGTTDAGVWVSVEDTGGGIPEEAINRVFEPYYTTKKKGSGLGLMIVQRIVRAHHGRINVESHVGRGTRFRIWLPIPPQIRLLEERSE